MRAIVRGLVVIALAGAQSRVARAQHTILVSADPVGAAGNGNSGVGTISPNSAPATGLCVSANGRLVAFYSEAQDLVTPATPGGQIYIRDMRSRTTRVGTVNLTGQPSYGLLPELSARGRFLAFASLASDLVPNDTNGRYDVFVADFATGVTARVSVSSAGTEGNGNSGWRDGILNQFVKPQGLSLSADGRYVAFSSDASNLVPNDTNSRADVFVRDRQSGLTTLVSVQDPAVPHLSGAQTGAIRPRLSADGRWVGFSSNSNDLVPNDTHDSTTTDAFVRDLATNTTTRVSVDSVGGQANGGSMLVALSADGRLALFTSYATNLVAAPVTTSQAYILDIVTGHTTLESLDSNGAPASAASSALDLSPDGRFILFASNATNLVPGDTNGQEDLFLRDRLLGTVVRVSVGPGGVQADQPSGLGRLANGGRATVFATLATTFSPLDTNGLYDVYFKY